VAIDGMAAGAMVLVQQLNPVAGQPETRDQELIMNKVIRALAAAGAVAVVPLGLATPAHASTQSSSNSNGYGWVKVCQKIYDYDYNYDYWGDYGIDDSYHHSWDEQLGGRSYDCFKVKVKAGWVNVYVNQYAHDADFDSYQNDWYHFKVRQGYIYTVTFKYHDSSYAPAHATAAS
jgi:hypothetical protein